MTPNVIFPLIRLPIGTFNIFKLSVGEGEGRARAEY